MGLFFCADTRKHNPPQVMTFVIFLSIRGVLFQPKNQIERQMSAEETVKNLNLQAIENLEVLISNIETILYNELKLYSVPSAIKNVEVGIVLASPLAVGKNLNEIKNLFKDHPISKKIIGKIEDPKSLEDVKNKGIAIKNWLTLQQALPGNKLCGYLVIDDHNANISKYHMEQCVLCNPQTLFNEDKLNSALTLAKLQFEPECSTESDMDSSISDQSLIDDSEEDVIGSYCCL